MSTTFNVKSFPFSLSPLLQVSVSPHALLLGSGSHWYAFSHYRLNFLSKAFLWMESYSIFSFVGHFCSKKCFWDSLMLFHISVYLFIFIADNILLQIYYKSFIHLLMNIWVASSFSYYEWSYSEYLCESFCGLSFLFSGYISQGSVKKYKPHSSLKRESLIEKY